jgi:hypothetical protein
LNANQKIFYDHVSAGCGSYSYTKWKFSPVGGNVYLLQNQFDGTPCMKVDPQTLAATTGTCTNIPAFQFKYVSPPWLIRAVSRLAAFTLLSSALPR